MSQLSAQGQIRATSWIQLKCNSKNKSKCISDNVTRLSMYKMAVETRSSPAIKCVYMNHALQLVEQIQTTQVHQRYDQNQQTTVHKGSDNIQ